MPNPVKFSIITVCYNAQEHIEAAIQSVLSQTYPNIEYVIIDGASTDKTLDIVNRYHNRIAKVISEKDNGIYDAMNKGIQASSGDILYFLNSDDQLYDNSVVSAVAKEFEANPEVGIVCGLVKFLNFPQNIKVSTKSATTFFTRKRDIILWHMNHQRIFCRRKVFDLIGIFDLRYRILADQDWFLRAFNKQILIKYSDRHVAIYNLQGKSYQNRMPSIREKLLIIWRNSLADFLIYSWDKFITTLKDLVTSLIRQKG